MFEQVVRPFLIVRHWTKPLRLSGRGCGTERLGTSSANMWGRTNSRSCGRTVAMASATCSTVHQIYLTTRIIR